MMKSLPLLAFLLFSCAIAAETKPAPPFMDKESEEALKAPALGPNLIANGNFEEGKYWPKGWDPCDKLGTMWVDGGPDGMKCIRIDTTIKETQWVEWNEKVLALAKDATERGKGDPQSLPEDPIPAPPQRVPYESKYAAVGGNHGIHYRSAFIPVEPGAIYRIVIDGRTDGKGLPKVFVKGYFDQKRKTESGEIVLKRDCWRSEMSLFGCSKEWKRFSRLVHPAESKTTVEGKPVQPEWLRVEIYAYWPAGTYEFDNVRLEVVGHEPIANPPKPDAPAPAKERASGAAPESAANDEEFPRIPK